VQAMMVLSLNNFSVSLNVQMNYARNYENLLNFVKVMLETVMVPFFSGRSVSNYMY